MALIRYGAAAIVAGVISVASVQAQAQRWLRGTIDSVEARAMTMTARGGEHVRLALADDLSVRWVVRISPDAIKPGSYIGASALPQPDGTLKAQEVHVFPESMRGAGEGHHPWDLTPGSTMTNATVGTVEGTQGRTVKVSYPGGEKTIYVPPETPVVTYEPATRAALTPGAHVFVAATQGQDGTMTATRVSVGKDGLTPPM